MIKPTVGRVLLYWPLASERAHSHAQPFAVQICHVWSDSCVNIAGYNENGEAFRRRSVILAQDREADDGECGWMPYQVGQAAKEAA